MRRLRSTGLLRAWCARRSSRPRTSLPDVRPPRPRRPRADREHAGDRPPVRRAPPSTRPARPPRSASRPCCCSGCRPRRTRRAPARGTTRGSSSSPRARSRPQHPDLLVITDLCLCEYTSHGHCGVLREDGEVDNDLTLELLARTAVSQAEAGADVVAPSDMMDGRVGALRAALDEHGLAETPIMAYSRQVRLRVLRPVPRGRRVGPVQGRPPRLPDGSRERARGRPRGQARRRRGRRRPHGQARAAVPRRDPARQGRHQPSRRRLQRQRRVRHAQGGRRRRPARRARRRARGADRHPPGRRGHRHHLPREGRRPDGSASAAQGPQPARRRRRPARRDRQAAAQPDAGPVPARAAALRARRRARRAAARTRSSSASSTCSTSGSSARSRRSSTRARSATRRCSSPPRSTPPTRTARRSSSTPTRASRTTTCATTTSTSGSRSPSSPTRSSAWTARSTSCSGRPAPSRSASCRRSSSSRSAWTSRWRPGPTRSRTAGEAAEPMELEPIALTEEDIATVRATQGPMPVVPEPYAPAAAEARRAASRRCWSGSSRCKRARRPAPRRGDPLPPPRRLLRQRHGRLGRPRGRDPRDRQADGRVPRHLALLPAADLRRLALLGLHDGPRALEGGVRRDPRLDRGDDRHRASARRSTRAPSSRRSGCSTSPTRSRAGKRSTRAEPDLPQRHALGGAAPPGAARPARRRELPGARDARRSAATRSSSSAPPARRSSTSTATRTSTTSAPGAR